MPIKIPISATLTSTDVYRPPFTVTFKSNNNCVFFDNSTITLDESAINSYVASTNVNFVDNSCLNNSIITVTFTDQNGCEKSSLVPITDPCSLLQNSISENGDFVFVATTSGGSPDYTYIWKFDENLFSSSTDNDIDDNTLVLNLITDSQPLSTVIECTVIDQNNCSVKTDYTYTFCKPSISNGNVSLNCNDKAVPNCNLSSFASSYPYFNISNFITVCNASQSIDWSTLSFNIPTYLCIVNHQDGRISIGSSRRLPTITNITYTVKTTSGIISNSGTLAVNIPECGLDAVVTTIPSTSQLVATNNLGDNINLNTSSRIAGDFDISSLTITTAPTFGTAVINAGGDIIYTITDLATTPSVPDVIKWSVDNTSGSNTVFQTDIILRDVIAAPVANTDTACTTCGSSTPAFDVTANDTGDIVKNTVTITENDPDITILKDSNNDLIFTASPGASFSNQVRYIVRNTQGSASNEAVIFVSAACTGTPQSPLTLTCLPSKTFDILDYFVGTNAFSTSFVEDGSTASPDYTAQGGLIVGAAGTVDFTGINNGTYRFRFTAGNTASCVGVDDVNYLTVIHGADPNITITGVVDNGDGSYTVSFTYVSMQGTFSVLDNGSAATFKSGIITSGGSGVFTIYSTSTNTITVEGLSICGSFVNDTDVIP